MNGFVGTTGKQGPSIEVEGLGKQYRLGERDPYGQFREALMGLPKRILGRLGKRHKKMLWAVKDVSFVVEPGEVVGLIGRNGSGKSTLLKMLSRITAPTTGRARIRGRVGSLLEVGTGFHPELTGRENIFLNGAILGMRRAEIARRFDEIVAFAEVEAFLDTPVKRFSSGMYLRLAFSVAAHLNSEILLVDEVLAVGDLQFQKKCLGKMGDVARGGRTVVLVSHNMGAISRLCDRAIWLDQGRIRLMADSEETIGAYIRSGAVLGGERRWDPPAEAPGDDPFRLTRLTLEDPEGRIADQFDIRRPIRISMEFSVEREYQPFRVGIRVQTHDGTTVFQSCGNLEGEAATVAAGRYQSHCTIPGDLLNEGNYYLMVAVDVPFVRVLCFSENLLTFRVVQTGGVSGQFAEKWPGVICPRLHWTIEKINRTLGAIQESEIGS